MLKILKTSQLIFIYFLFSVSLSPGVFTKTIFAAAGNLDISFGGDGIVSTPIPNNSFGAATDIIIQPDGKSVVSVLTQSQSGFGLAVVRHNPNGTRMMKIKLKNNQTTSRSDYMIENQR